MDLMVVMLLLLLILTKTYGALTVCWAPVSLVVRAFHAFLTQSSQEPDGVGYYLRLYLLHRL